jgi:signal peptidase II
MTPRRPVWPWYAGAASLLILDQVSKALVRHYLDLYQSIPLLGTDLLRLTYVLNPGIAFGARLFGMPLLLFFGWGAAFALAVFLYRLARRGDSLRWPVMLFLAGAIGNSIDRVIFGQVTDFLDADFPDFIMQRWPVFNVADSCITVGITVLALLALFARGQHARPSPADSHAPLSSESESDSLPADDRAGSTTAAD